MHVFISFINNLISFPCAYVNDASDEIMTIIYITEHELYNWYNLVMNIYKIVLQDIGKYISCILNPRKLFNAIILVIS